MYYFDDVAALPAPLPLAASAASAPWKLTRLSGPPGLRGMAVDFADPGSESRGTLERYVAASFAAAYGARLRHFLPKLMSLRDRRGELIAVCGLRDAALEPLFLETYLDLPPESILQAVTGFGVERGSLMEVGNLAITRPGMARYLIAALTEHLHCVRKEWAVFTAVPSLVNAFTRLGVRLVFLGRADIGRLPEAERGDWGRYYDTQPVVAAANVEQSRSAVHSKNLPAPAP
jgi:hypothetical protein